MTICLGEIDTEMIKQAIKLGYKPNCKKDMVYKSQDVAHKNRIYDN